MLRRETATKVRLMIKPATIVSIKVKPLTSRFSLEFEALIFFCLGVIGLKALECVISTPSDRTTYTSSQASKVFVFPIPQVIHFFHKLGWNAYG